MPRERWMTYFTGAKRSNSEGKGRFELISPFFLEKLAKILEVGARRIGEDRNWEKGIPLSRFWDSLNRHLNQYKQGDKSEDHISNALWNFHGFIHTKTLIDKGKLPKSLNDLPNYAGVEPDIKTNIDDTVEPELTGGSFSEIDVIKKNGIIRKSCSVDKRRLENEIQFLQGLPEDLKPYFTKLIDSGETEEDIWYTMRYEDMLSLKKLIMKGKMDASMTLDFLDNVMDFMTKNIYSKQKTDTPDNYVNSVHYKRVVDRSKITIEKAPLFKDIFNAQVVVINGIEYRNIIPIIDDMMACPKLAEILKPPFLSMIHGDLHIDNILVDMDVEENQPFKFILVDPKGFSKGDPMYDVSKLIHDFNGLYDFVYDYKFDLDWYKDQDAIIAQFSIHGGLAFEEFAKIKEFLTDRLAKYFTYDPHWYLRAKFVEAINFSSLQPFHLVGDGKEEKAVAMYLRGVKLLNYFWDSLPESVKIKDESFKHLTSDQVEDYTYSRNLFEDKGNNQFPGV